jgi:hypothetical protein
MAIAKPMPLVEPVTRAVLPFKWDIFFRYNKLMANPLTGICG